MITPTKTVCFLLDKDGQPHELIKHYLCGTLGDVFETKTPGSDLNSVWFLDCIERIVVREEPVRKEPEYPWCNKNFSPLNPCDCGDCDQVLKTYSNLRGETA